MISSNDIAVVGSFPYKKIGCKAAAFKSLWMILDAILNFGL